MSFWPHEDRHDPAGTPLSVLIAVHGYESEKWTRDAARVLTTWDAARVRVLGVLDVPCPASTSLTPASRRLYAAARAEWARQDELRLQPAIESLLSVLPRGVDVVRVASQRGDLAGTIATQAAEWPADVVVVGAPHPGLRSFFWPGPLHEQVLRRSPCAVLVIPAWAPAERPRRRLIPTRRPATALPGV